MERAVNELSIVVIIYLSIWGNTYEYRTRKGLADALPGSGPKLVEDASALVLQETLTRFGLNTHHQRDPTTRAKRAAQVSYM